MRLAVSFAAAAQGSTKPIGHLSRKSLRKPWCRGPESHYYGRLDPSGWTLLAFLGTRGGWPRSRRFSALAIWLRCLMTPLEAN
jgi:hypothetical protein